jgi:hypothetical protein
MTLHKLFHYTNQKGIIGILESRKLWATSILYMNDSKELLYALNLAKTIIDNLISSSKSEIKYFLKKFKKLLNVLPEESSNSVFIFSLSEESDLLSQWRGYCIDSNGYSIGFEITDEIPSIFTIQRFFLYKCEYDPTTQEKLIKDFFSETIRKYLEYKKGDLQIELVTIFILSLYRFVSLAAQIKHPSFHEEKEWRLISTPIPITDPGIKYRQGKSTLIPYYEIKITEENKPLELSEIVIWPHNELTKSSLEGLLIKNNVLGKKKTKIYNKDKGIIYIPNIRSSAIPYRLV